MSEIMRTRHPIGWMLAAAIFVWLLANAVSKSARPDSSVEIEPVFCKVDGVLWGGFCRTSALSHFVNTYDANEWAEEFDRDPRKAAKQDREAERHLRDAVSITGSRAGHVQRAGWPSLWMGRMVLTDGPMAIAGPDIEGLSLAETALMYRPWYYSWSALAKNLGV